MIQSGGFDDTNDSGTVETVTFPFPFPNTCDAVVVFQGASTFNSTWFRLGTLRAASFDIYMNNNVEGFGLYYLAIGH
jgi:hypothetical protein